MSDELTLLAATAVSLGFIHTIIGPDHYLPFIVLAKARRWSAAKTAWITFLCGLGHIASSVLLGFIGISLGLAVASLEDFESARGSIAAWGMIAFGLVYFIWGVRRAIRNKPHRHIHVHADGSTHDHEHKHQNEHLHPHDALAKVSLTPWVLFTIFVFGPCEPLIPLLIYPAAEHSLPGLLLVVSLFGGATILTMLAVVLAMSYGFRFLPLGKLERYSHTIAGGTIFLSGAAIQFLGL